MDDNWTDRLGRRDDETEPTWGGRGPPSLFLQLPSNQTLRLRGNKAVDWGAAWEGASEPTVDPQELIPEFVPGEEEEDSKPLKELPLSLAEKRKLRALQEQAASRLTGWDLWRVEKQRTLRRLRNQAGNAFSYAEMWRSSLHHIGGHFGTGIQSYFNFLRFLVLMNFVASLLVVGFVVAPNAAFESLHLNWTSQHNNSSVNESCLRYDPSPKGLVSYFSYIMNLLSGQGFMELTYLFYGYYQNSAVDFVGFSYNVPLAYLLTVFFYLLFCLAWIVRRSVYCLKRSLVSEDASFGSYSDKVFAGWDFGLMQEKMVKLRHRSIRYELKMDLEEAALRKHQAEQTTSQRVCLYALRGLVNVIVLGLLGASFYCIYRATDYSQWLQGKEDSPVKGQFFLKLLVAYLPSVVITLANLIVPIISESIVRLEKYPLSFEIKITLLRNVFLRIASLVVVLVSLWGQITCNGDLENADCRNCGYNNTLYLCWETAVGQEMYKLMIFDLLIMLLVVMFVEFPRKMLVTFLPSCPLLKLWGQQEFMVPSNVLDLVYGQTLCWTGALFCPLLPVLNTIKYIAVFYLKKLTLFSNCRPADRTFRASSSNFFFLLVLLLGLIISCVPALYSMFVIHPSEACGPFRGEPAMWNTVSSAISELPKMARNFFRFVGSLAFAVPLFLLLSILMFYLKALADSYSSVVKGLKGQLRLEGQDKLFLVKQISELSQ
ncbi:transmembrane channel-like protein 4 [Anolis carolinensis]|uniref:Transmembrane channel-like protein n=1 Tax=Anolis carolinensis TaxID=28377 RepID=H9GMY6_ANOCA|nr:PREDICTED: transmembrane channel-like protein 4 [Anolis carolinensis]|eukprot:XP_008115447.1 PREDICTED: transmembrane channel-like protein 4 [Anolis carolinensis]